jgi:hypothetical protein
MVRASNFRDILGLVFTSYTKGSLISKKLPANPNLIEQTPEMGELGVFNVFYQLSDNLLT